MPTIENCADIGSRGCFGDKLPLTWFTGLSWLTQEKLWPKNIITTSTPESSSESKVIRTALKSVLALKDYLYNAIGRFNFGKSMRITSWIFLFRNICRNHQHEQTAEEIRAAVNLRRVKIQKEMRDDHQYKQYEEQLNLVKDEQEMFVWKGRIQGFYPIFFPTNSTFAEKMVMDAHLRTLHREVENIG